MDRDIAMPFNGLRPHWLGVLILTAVVGDAQALGVGRPLTQSALGQPLNLLFPIRLGSDETLSPECVRAEVLAGDARVPPGQLQLRLEGESESSVRAVRVLSAVQIDEPIVSVNLTLGCPARFTRQYTAFIDPPDMRAPLPAAPAPMAEPGVRNYSPALRAALATAEAKPSTLLAEGAGTAIVPELASLAPAAGASAPAAAASAASGAAAGRASAQPVARPARAASRPAARKTAPLADDEPLAVARTAPKKSDKAAAKPIARLQLDRPELLEPVAVPAPPASSPELDAALARLQKLEEGLNKAQQENRETQEKLVALRAQLEKAQGERYQNPVSIALGVLVLGLLGAVAYLWHSRRSERQLRDSAWWAEVQNEQREQRESRLESGRATTVSGALAPLPSQPQPSSSASRAQRPPVAAAPSGFGEHTMSGAFLEAEERERTMTLPRLADGDSLLDLPGEVQTQETVRALAREAARAPALSLVPEPPEPVHEPLSVQFVDSRLAPPLASVEASPHVTVEELIDLEQQVDFFQVLGQDDAAVELLRSRVDTGVASALPYLKLLEIYQRQGDQLSFGELTARFEQRFQALPPTWGADLSRGQHLEAYGSVMQRVQALWSDSGASMVLLQKLLSHGGEDAQEQARGFDLPAYRDLLLLYGVARDLSEHEVRGAEIDLFLPLDAQAGAAGAGMMATMIWQATPSLAVGHLELDISLDDLPDAPATPDGPRTTR